MTGDRSPGGSPCRPALVTAALRLAAASVCFGVLSGAAAVITGLRDHSLGVFAVGLGVLADVTGSAALVWRFRAERRHPARSGFVVLTPLALAKYRGPTGSRPWSSRLPPRRRRGTPPRGGRALEPASGTCPRTFSARVSGPETAARPTIQVTGPQLGRQGDFLLDLLSNIVSLR